MQVLVAPAATAPLRVTPATREPVRVALVQMRWHEDPARHRAELDEGVRLAAEAGAGVVFLPELTLGRYPGDTPAAGRVKDTAEDLETGPTTTFAREAARRHGVFVHASLFERPAADDAPDDPRGYNTAILVSPEGELVGRTRKTHIPISAGYYEDTFFRPGPAGDAHPVYAPAGLGARVGLPTCWDEWFPELARAYGLAGAEILAYPTAIGSEPTFPDFDTRDIWRHVIVANGITSGLFLVVPNRWGDEGAITFYGSSFISDPFGRILVEAPRDASAVLVADLDLAQREEWLKLFPFYVTRRPDLYGSLVEPVDRERDSYGAFEAIAESLS
ncbi:(R)-stereoselective amidase [Frondihabitans sp. 762G35]|uniref:nitrilase-related carbon-nitrogen hydrolase n=1 Tax=Frondihabitans sp. 762G35 TaxID=1446794 RepID=UPI000D2094D1|nr:nitrilase-related carbon-nitrogen hydrolase [Frondihabitans sp. 762G35]ARC57837.1 (R)-stereoselective amidase [Frondihabitans sp. 762G35]